MKKISQHIGSRIRSYRKMRKLTLQELADKIYKSRATVSKYETGEIALDVDTLYDISIALNVDLNRLIEFNSFKPGQNPTMNHTVIPGPFYGAREMYFYFYDGRVGALQEGIIQIEKAELKKGASAATLTVNTISQGSFKREILYTGKVVYSDMLIRFSLSNSYNTFEECLLYIFNPLEKREYTEGLFCGISGNDLMPCAFKCYVTLGKRALDEELKENLMISSKEFSKFKKSNMLMIENS